MTQLPPLLTAYAATISALLGAVSASAIGCAATRAAKKEAEADKQKQKEQISQKEEQKEGNFAASCDKNGSDDGKNGKNKGESFFRGRSHCDFCGVTLSPADLVPVFSYIFLRGRCRRCGARLSALYPVTEALLAVAFALAFIFFGISAHTAELFVLFSILLYISVYDIKSYLIPDGALILALAVRAVFILTSGNIVGELIRSAVGALSVSLPLLFITLIMERIIGREAMGGGDIKLFFVVGYYLGWSLTLLTLIFACIIGIVFGTIAIGIADKRRGAVRETDNGSDTVSDDNKEKERNNKYISHDSEKTASDGSSGDETAAHMIPFGPSIAAGAAIAALVGEQIIIFYLGLF